MIYIDIACVLLSLLFYILASRALKQAKKIAESYKSE